MSAVHPQQNMARLAYKTETLSVGQLAKRWGVSPQRIRRMVEDGSLTGAFRIPASGRYRTCIKIPLCTVLEAEDRWAVIPAKETPRRRLSRNAKSNTSPVLKHFPELSQNHEPAAGYREDEEH